MNHLTGSLTNLETLPSSAYEAGDFIKKYGKFYQGGNAQILHKLLQLHSGDSLLYVGDHIYSDILRSKRTLGWRTCLIVPELATEIVTHKKSRPKREELMLLRKKQYALESQLEKLYFKLRSTSATEAPKAAEQSEAVHGDAHSQGASSRLQAEEERDRLTNELSLLKEEIRGKLAVYDSGFHPRWGQLFKAGFRESRIAKQVTSY